MKGPVEVVVMRPAIALLLVSVALGEDSEEKWVNRLDGWARQRLIL